MPVQYKKKANRSERTIVAKNNIRKILPVIVSLFLRFE